MASGDSAGSTGGGGTTSEAPTSADASSDSGTVPGEPTYTFHRDIRPIIEGRCLGCHAEDGIAPFSLATYEDVEALGAVVASVVEARTMPPWPADSQCNTYDSDPSLSDEQIEAIRTWVDEGAPEGDPSEAGDPLEDLTVELPRIDFEIAMSEAHIPAAEDPGGYDEHICFLLDWPLEEDAFIRGYEVRPGNRRAAHHLVASIVPPAGLAEFQEADDAYPGYGWRCGAGTGMTPGERTLMGAWVPGSGASVFPEDTGLRVPAGSAVLINMHYNLAPGDDSPDQTRIDIMVEDTVAREGRSVFILDPAWLEGDNMLIPAGEAGVVHEADFGIERFGVPIEIHEVGMHMHTFGRQGRLWVEHEAGGETCIADIPRWDFDWQLGYPLQSGVRVEAGDRIGLRCSFDNTAADQPVIDGVQQEPRNVTWGEDTFDEMCMAAVYAVPAM